MSIPAGELPANVVDALRRGNTIEAIKLLRASTGLDLKQAKDAIDRHTLGQPVGIIAAYSGQLPSSVVAELQKGNKIGAIRLLREQTGLGLKEAKDAVEAPARLTLGQTSPAFTHIPGNVIWVLLALVIAAALLGYHYFGGPG